MSPLSQSGHSHGRSRGKLSRFRRLPVEAQWVLLKALLLLPLNLVALRLIGYHRWRAMLGAWLPPHQTPAQHGGRNSSLPPERIGQIVHAASREGLCTGACLERALTLWWLLRRRNFPAELRLGARRKAGRFEAHAWVQLEGMVLNDDEAVLQYAPFETSAADAGEDLTRDKS